MLSTAINNQRQLYRDMLASVPHYTKELRECADNIVYLAAERFVVKLVKYTSKKI